LAQLIAWREEIAAEREVAAGDLAEALAVQSTAATGRGDAEAAAQVWQLTLAPLQGPMSHALARRLVDIQAGLRDAEAALGRANAAVAVAQHRLKDCTQGLADIDTITLSPAAIEATA
jgi:hypothetical protein